jgi:hypothetical protein
VSKIRTIDLADYFGVRKRLNILYDVMALAGVARRTPGNRFFTHREARKVLEAYFRRVGERALNPSDRWMDIKKNRPVGDFVAEQVRNGASPEDDEEPGQSEQLDPAPREDEQRDAWRGTPGRPVGPGNR